MIPSDTGVIMNRSITPPPASCLPSPPPTGGLDKQANFLETELAHAISKRMSKVNEEESPTAFFEDHQEGSDVELEDLEDESLCSTDDTSLASSDSSASSAPSIIKKQVEFGPLATPVLARTITEPFPLLKLPLSVRNRIYEYLLVVPGLIRVRQKHSSSNEGFGGLLHTEPRQLLPGIAYALVELTVNGYKVLFSRFATTNINVLLACKEVHVESRAVLYGKNNFGIARPSTELTPPSDFSVRLFPPGCQRLVTKLNICIRSFYDLQWLLTGGYNKVKNFYRGLNTLTLVLELDSMNKGYGRQWAKQTGEEWDAYVKRLQIEVAKDAFAVGKGKKVKTIPAWIKLQVMFHGESYDEKLNATKTITGQATEQEKCDELRCALVEAWELFKRGSR
jgi:hypothetical protein